MEFFYLIEYNNKIIGVYTNLDKAKSFIFGCFQNQLMNSNVTIKKYTPNSCYCSDTNIIYYNSLNTNTKITNNINTINNINTEITNIDYNNPAIVEITNKKIDIQHNINLLKTQKKKIEESKNTYSNDLKLFELFTESKKKDKQFIIPEIFSSKFELMTQLSHDNLLSWENFVKEYSHNNLYNDYFNINKYDEMFLNSDNENKSDISEELVIESDSNTEISENND
jgi:hypothetical protein